MSKSTRVKKDELDNLNLGFLEDPYINAELEHTFKAQLHKLLLEFKDIFAWHRTGMKVVDPSFCKHRIKDYC